jgi:hypothetical protein
MEIGPIPNLIPMRMAAPSATPTDVPTTRAIDLRRQQEQDDATYTPSGRKNGKESDEEQQDCLETAQMAAGVGLDAASGEPISPRTISVFA